MALWRTDLRTLTRQVAPLTPNDFFENEFWLSGTNVELPLRNSIEEIAETADAFLTQCESSGVSLCGIESAVVLPPDFNDSIEREGNKANVLSQRTLGVVAGLLEGCDGDVFIDCDKHGGRSSYGALIQNCLTDQDVRMILESANQSAYQWTADHVNATIRFTAKGEGQLAVALASMVSKYVREVYMVAWNAYWSAHQQDLKPTKGYPEDAKRFRLDIAQTQKRLGIRQEQYWRCR